YAQALAGAGSRNSVPSRRNRQGHGVNRAKGAAAQKEAVRYGPSHCSCHIRAGGGEQLRVGGEGDGNYLLACGAFWERVVRGERQSPGKRAPYGHGDILVAGGYEFDIGGEAD